MHQTCRSPKRAGGHFQLLLVRGMGFLALLLACMPQGAFAQNAELAQRCWAESTPWRTRADLREPTAVQIGNLRQGDTVRTPFWLDFGMRGMGVIPAGSKHAKAGHHHILVDTPLPKNHLEKIPFSDKYRHFGKGQTGTLLNLTPGRHTLRLLFADHEHRPYFIFSPEISITVEGQRADPPLVVTASDYAQTCLRWLANELTQPRPTDPHVFLRNVRPNDVLGRVSLVGLGVIGFGVAPADTALPDTGHFVLTVTTGRGSIADVKRLTGGNTETLLELAPGKYQLLVSFVASSGKTLLTGDPVPITVARG